MNLSELLGAIHELFNPKKFSPEEWSEALVTEFRRRCEEKYEEVTPV